MTVRRFLPVSALAMAFLASTVLTTPAFAEAPRPDTPRRPGEIARERVDEVLRSLEKFVAGLPRYGLPEITAKGDILIPRENPPTDMPAKKSPGSDSADI